MRREEDRLCMLPWVDCEWESLGGGVVTVTGSGLRARLTLRRVAMRVWRRREGGTQAPGKLKAESSAETSAELDFVCYFYKNSISIFTVRAVKLKSSLF